MTDRAITAAPPPGRALSRSTTGFQDQLRSCGAFRLRRRHRSQMAALPARPADPTQDTPVKAHRDHPVSRQQPVPEPTLVRATGRAGGPLRPRPVLMIAWKSCWSWGWQHKRRGDAARPLRLEAAVVDAIHRVAGQGLWVDRVGRRQPSFSASWSWMGSPRGWVHRRAARAGIRLPRTGPGT